MIALPNKPPAVVFRTVSSTRRCQRRIMAFDAMAFDATESIRLTGKAIGSFVLFYASMRWIWYRKQRIDAEDKK